VTNIEDTISINHNWYNGCNIEVVFDNMAEELDKVQKEISDCEGEGWADLCQQLLLDSHGVNYRQFLALLETVANRRIKMLDDPSFKVVFDNVILGENHAKFDLKNIAKLLTKMKKAFNELKFLNETESCQDLLSRIEKVINNAAR